MNSFLLVTDSTGIVEETRGLLETLLGSVHLEVVHEDGRLALSRIQSTSPQLAILPLGMRHMEALTLLRILGPAASSKVLLLVPDTLDGLRIAWDGLCLGAGDLLLTKGRPPQRIRGNRGQRLRQLAQHLEHEEVEAPHVIPEIPHNAFERPWVVCPEMRHMRSVVEWLRALPRECPIVLRIPEGPRLRRVVREELGRMISWPVRELIDGDRLVPGQVHLFAEPEMVEITNNRGHAAARLFSSTALQGSWAARRDLLTTLGRSDIPIGLLAGEAIEPEEASWVGDAASPDCRILTIESLRDRFGVMSEDLRRAA